MLSAKSWKTGLAIAAVVAGSGPVWAQTSGALAQCETRGLAEFCDLEDQRGSACQLIAQGDLKSAERITDQLRDPRSVLPISLALSCEWLKHGAPGEAWGVLQRAVERSVEDLKRTERPEGVLGLILETAALQAAAGDEEDARISLRALEWAAPYHASVSGRWLAHLTGAAAFSAAGEGREADRLLDAAAAITRALPDAPEDGPPRISYLHHLVQSAAEARRWERAEAFLKDLRREPPVRKSRYFGDDAVQGYARLRQWLTDVVAARNIGIPLPTVAD